MKKLMMTLAIVAILVLPGCCCKRSGAPKAKPAVHKIKAVSRKAAPKKKHDDKKKHDAKKSKKHDDKKNHKKYSHVELDNNDELFA
jgi:outer membrane biogenesis lipoprotein LolB